MDISLVLESLHLLPLLILESCTGIISMLAHFLKGANSMYKNWFSSDILITGIKGQATRYVTRLTTELEEEVECVVCLCKVEEGEEICKLRCDHLFHKVCLDRWLGYQKSTCPLCRGSALQPTMVEMLLFMFSGPRRSGDHDHWWLR